MAENFVVNYDINVLSQDAVQAIDKFVTAANKVANAATPFRKLNESINSVNNRLTALGKKTASVKIDTSKANQALDKLIGRMRQLEAISQRLNISVGAVAASQGMKTGNVGSGTATTAAAAGAAGTSRSTQKTGTSSRSSAKNNRNLFQRLPNNLTYKLVGPTPLDVNGIIGVDMLKGMGIAYGIAGIGSLINNTVKDYAEYNNIMQTVKNITGAHDKREDFDQRFKMMEDQVRNVGVRTKFTAPQVADAAKFLAMAGFGVDAINKSIVPIADIALVGDTDLGQTADVVTNIMKGYKISPEKIRKAADVMTMTFTMSNTTLMEIAEAYKYSASLLEAGNVPFEEATAAIGILGDAGIKGSQAGTTMRTIMANIVNPTKKQAAAWKRIGVSRTDKKGNVRDIVDIFEDLDKKNLSLSDYYQIFHKTAAQGAVSLVNDVEGWHKIIKASLMSDGLTKEQADAKKDNTVKGLWSQLVSMFTENGIEAFNEIQQPIMDFLKNIIGWLKTDEAKNFIKDVTKDLMEFAKMVVELTRTLLTFYDTFKGIINWFIKFQMYMMPLLSVARIGKAFGLGALGVLKFAYSIGTLAKNLQFLNIRQKSLISLGAFFNGNAGMGNMTYIGNGQVAVGNSGRITTKAAANRYNAIFGKKAGRSIAGTASSLAIGALGGYAGYQIGDNISNGDPIGGILGGMIGASIGPIATFAWQLLKSRPLLVIPSTIIACGAAFLKYKNDVEEAHEANKKFLESTASINGINYSEHATMSDKYLSIVYNKQMDVNQAIGEHINLMREQLGIMSDAEKKYSDKTLGETHGDTVKNAAKPFYKSLFKNTDDQRKAATDPFQLPDGTIDYIMSPHLQEYWDRQGKSRKQWIFNGRQFADSGYDYTRLAAARFLYGLGRDTSEGSDLQKIKESLNKRLFASSDTEDFYAVMQDVDNYRIKKYLSESKNWRMQDLEDKPESEWKRSYDYVSAFNDTLLKQFDWANPMSSANAQMWNDFHEILEKMKTDDVSEELLSKFLLHAGIPIFDEQRFGKFGSAEQMREFGWFDNEWHAGQYKFFNEKTGQIEKMYVQKEEARQSFLLFHKMIVDLTNRMTPKVKAYFESFLNNPVWGYGDTVNGYNGSNGEVTWDGVKWTWDEKDKKWHAPGPVVPITDEEMKKNLKNTPGGGRNGRGGSSLTPGSHNTHASTADYKQHYNTNTAAPKQVIVKIENLMNVKSIDLSKADNKEVIDNVKAQLTQALVDVVHDFDETWHG